MRRLTGGLRVGFADFGGVISPAPPSSEASPRFAPVGLLRAFGDERASPPSIPSFATNFGVAFDDLGKVAPVRLAAPARRAQNAPGHPHVGALRLLRRRGRELADTPRPEIRGRVCGCAVRWRGSLV